MNGFEKAQAIYTDVIEEGHMTAHELAEGLRVRAEKERGVREGIRSETRGKAEQVLSDSEPPCEEAAKHLENAASDIEAVFGDYSAEFNDLPGNTAGQAELGSGLFEIDPESIQRGSGRIIDVGVAESVREHELEHTRQSPASDQAGIEVNGRKFDSREVREAAAMSTQVQLHKETGFLSGEYKRIMSALPMEREDILLVRRGELKKLEMKKNGIRQEEELGMAA